MEKLSPTPLRALTLALLASASIVSAPLGSTIAYGSSVHIIPIASKVPSSKLVNIALHHPTLSVPATLGSVAHANPSEWCPRPIYVASRTTTTVLRLHPLRHHQCHLNHLQLR